MRLSRNSSASSRRRSKHMAQSVNRSPEKWRKARANKPARTTRCRLRALRDRRAEPTTSPSAQFSSGWRGRPTPLSNEILTPSIGKLSSKSLHSRRWICCGAKCWLKLHALSALVADGLDRAALFGFLAPRFLFRRFRLLVTGGIAAVFIALALVRRGFSPQIAIDTLVIYVVFSGEIFSVF